MHILTNGKSPSFIYERSLLSLRIHIVQKGETIWDIAQKYGVDYEEVIALNPQISSPDMIMPGMKIKIPSSPKQVPQEKHEKEYAKKPIEKKKNKQPIDKKPKKETKKQKKTSKQKTEEPIELTTPPAFAMPPIPVLTSEDDFSEDFSTKKEMMHQKELTKEKETKQKGMKHSQKESQQAAEFQLPYGVPLQGNAQEGPYHYQPYPVGPMPVGPCYCCYMRAYQPTQPYFSYAPMAQPWGGISYGYAPQQGMTPSMGDESQNIYKSESERTLQQTDSFDGWSPHMRLMQQESTQQAEGKNDSSNLGSTNPLQPPVPPIYPRPMEEENEDE